ncbi:YihY/virulence factor BrkB family protein [Gracilibacillus caseinilyticus]|uniref:YihY/virulence factor BrkB family protein n=1 Tax=Gracilibacillus caseinilyticus TaxID=2932256 RepID=A0ABY4F1D2_9BACI|nr:YihY/virulence factor BrkB family protein [Gracilibacillus caseinilyticus]UOQ50485.1 YihY/virulence factor BrkB family protein [Gracilibacillus caseinilyticus]
MRPVVFVKQLIERITGDDVPGLAAQLSYFFLLSLFPFMIFLVTLIGYLPWQDIDVMNFIATYAPEEIMTMLNENISQIMNNRNGSLLSIGIIGTLWSASNGINALIRSFNRAYNIDEERSFIVTRMISIVLTIAMLLIIIVAFLLPIFGKMIGVYLFSFFGLSEGFLSTWNTLRWVISSAIFFIVLMMLYRLAPSKRVYFKDIIPGTLFATVFWQLASLAFSYYVSSMGNYSATYGSLGGVISLMIWFYLSGIIIITGGEINAQVEKMVKGRA